MRLLHELVAEAARRWPEALAVADPDHRLTYAELDATANQAARALAAVGVRRGDRVPLWLDKSARMVATMQGVLRLGAAYVPVDPLSPPHRAIAMIHDCSPSAVVTTADRAQLLGQRGTGDPGALSPVPTVLPATIDAMPADPLPAPGGGEAGDLAYILYTSGSTGTPKGVCLSHRNALAFVEWAAGELRVTPTDRLANHAPFHFDLSVLDLYVAFDAGASVHLVPPQLAYAPGSLVSFLQEQVITVWYSVPSALVLMERDGGLLTAQLPALRAVLFAGEPYPLPQLRRLRDHLGSARLLNLYGPTETNVCTWHEVTILPADSTTPIPIGRQCSGDTVWVARPDGSPADVGEPGELWVAGPTVMLGYWGHPSQGTRPYRTGDRVVRDADGNHHFLGRLDSMVKVRGNRVELAEIEAVLHTHPGVSDAAVVDVGEGLQTRLVSFLVPTPGQRIDLLSVKRHCAERLPRHMIVDSVRRLDDLPRTATGKLDRRRLREWAAQQRMH